MKFFFSSSDAIFETRDYCTLVCKIRNEAALTQMLTQNRKNACGNNGADGMQFSLVGGQRAANGAERTGNPVPSAPDVSSHAGGRWFESISLHQDIETRTFPIMGWFGFSVLSILAKIAGLIDEKLSSLRSICRIPCDSRQGLCPIFQYSLFIHIRRVPSAPF